MNETNTPSTPKSQAMLVKIIWFALFMSNWMFLFVSHFLRGNGSEAPISASEGLPPQIFFVMGGVSLVISQILPKFIARALSPQNEVQSERTEDGSPAPLSPRMFSALFTPMVIELAILESVSLYGFILGFTQGRLDLHRIFFGVAIVFVIRAYPTSLEKLRDRYLGR